MGGDVISFGFGVVVGVLFGFALAVFLLHIYP